MKTTKRILIIGLAIILVLSMVGCASKKEVSEKLCGKWGYIVQSINGPCYKIYVFNSDGTFEANWINENAPAKNSSSEGNYVIKGSKITLKESDGDIETIIEYTLKDDVLSLTDKNSDNSGNHTLINFD